MNRLSFLFLASLLVTALACDSTAPAPPPGEQPLAPNTFKAELRGALTADIAGTVTLGVEDEYDGYFIELDSAHVIEDGTYTLIELEADDTPDRLRFVQFGDGLSESSYPVTPGFVSPTSDIEPPYPFQIFYRRPGATPADDLQGKASSGSVTFTSVTDDLLQGSFEFVVDVSGEELRVSGTFSAMRHSFGEPAESAPGETEQAVEQIVLVNGTDVPFYYVAWELEMSHTVDPVPAFDPDAVPLPKLEPGASVSVDDITGYSEGDDVRFFLYALGEDDTGTPLVRLVKLLTVTNEELLQHDGRVEVTAL